MARVYEWQRKSASCESPAVEGYNFSTEVVVRFAETDAQAIAHHAAFVVWLEVARIAYLAEHAGGYRAIQAQGIEALTTEVHVHYHHAARFDDRLRIWARCADLRGARFRYEYVVEREGEIVAAGHTSHATVDATTHQPTRVPAWFVEAVAKAES
jgi:acyl-CoA thioester hydrolase